MKHDRFGSHKQTSMINFRRRELSLAKNSQVWIYQLGWWYTAEDDDSLYTFQKLLIYRKRS